METWFAALPLYLRKASGFPSPTQKDLPRSRGEASRLIRRTPVKPEAFRKDSGEAGSRIFHC